MSTQGGNMAAAAWQRGSIEQHAGQRQAHLPHTGEVPKREGQALLALLFLPGSGSQHAPQGLLAKFPSSVAAKAP